MDISGLKKLPKIHDRFGQTTGVGCDDAAATGQAFQSHNPETFFSVGRDDYHSMPVQNRFNFSAF